MGDENRTINQKVYRSSLTERNITMPSLRLEFCHRDQTKANGRVIIVDWTPIEAEGTIMCGVLRFGGNNPCIKRLACRAISASAELVVVSCCCCRGACTRHARVLGCKFKRWQCNAYVVIYQQTHTRRPGDGGSSNCVNQSPNCSSFQYSRVQSIHAELTACRVEWAHYTEMRCAAKRRRQTHTPGLHFRETI